MDSVSDLPGFYKDPETGRYYAIPQNPSTCVPNFTFKKNARTLFKKAPITIFKHTPHHGNVSGLPNIISYYQKGLVNRQDFKTQVQKLYLSRLQKVYQSPLVFMGKCKYVVHNDSTFVVVWFQNGFTTLSEIVLSKESSQRPHFIKERIINRYYGYTITHLALTQIFGHNYIIKCAEKYLAESTLQIFPLTFAQRNTRFGYSVESTNEMFRYCTTNDLKQVIAIGMNRGLDLLKFSSSHNPVSIIPKNVSKNFSNHDQKAGDFIFNGNVIVSYSEGFNVGTLKAYDIRMKRVTKVADLGRGVESMKVLNNDETIITSGYDNKLSRVDIRMNKVVLEYPDHYNKHRKLLFTCDEHHDVLCCTGQDNVTRFWSLKLGEPLASITPPLENDDDQVHSIFCPWNNELSTAIFFDNKMTIYEPVFKSVID